MRRRLRKKLRTAEFTEYGFEVKATIRPDIPAPAKDAPVSAWGPYWDFYIDRWEVEFEPFLHERGLCSGGGTGQTWDLFVTSARSATEEDRKAVAEKLRSIEWIVDFHIGELINANG